MQSNDRSLAMSQQRVIAIRAHRVVSALAFPCVIWVCNALVVAAEPEAREKPDKSVYHLFNPTPGEYMREMTTDRPDKTESPFTIDAGHFQLEMDLVTYAHDRSKTGGASTRTDAFSIAPVNLKVGVLNNVDFQLLLETYTHVRTKGGGVVQRRAGFGDVTPRLKINFWGNDGGSTAFAMMPFAKIPSNQDELGNDSVEGGVIFPLAVDLPGGWGAGLMTEFDFLRNDSDSDYMSSFINSITFGHDIYRNLAGYIEFFSEIPSEGRGWVGTIDLGLTFGLTHNIQLDGGVNIGVTDIADDVNPFLGFSWRF